MISGADPRTRRAVGEVIAGVGLLLFGLVLAVLGLLPVGPSDAGLLGVAAFAASALGLAFLLGGAAEIRR